MWKPPPMLVDSFTSISGQAAAAILYAVLAQHHATNQSELCSELVCWILLPLFFRAANGLQAEVTNNSVSKASLPANAASRPGKTAFPMSVWLVAAGLTIASVYKAESKTTIAFLPILTPILLSVQRHFRSDYEYPNSTRTFGLRLAGIISDTVWGTSLVAVFAILTLTNWDLRPSYLSAIPVAALLVVYVALVHGSAPQRTRLLPIIDIEASLDYLSTRVGFLLAAALVVETISFGFPADNVLNTMFLGLMKALSWYFTIRTARYMSWCIGPAIGVFSVSSTRDPFMQVSEFQAFSTTVVSLFALAQVIHIVSRRSKTSPYLWALALISLIPYWLNILAIRSANLSANTFASAFSMHPVEKLSGLYKDEFNTLLQRQSTNYTAAYAEYQRRYSMDPPPGFEAWYEFAASHESLIIDDFDSIHESIAPFWSMSGNEVLNTMQDVQKSPHSELWMCSFSGDSAETRCTHPFRTFDRHIQFSFNELLKDVGGGVLPDMMFLVNHLDEPRVLIPPRSVRGGGSGYSFGNGNFRLVDMSRQPVGPEIMKYCAAQRSHGGARTKARNTDTYGLPFVADPRSANDLCGNPDHVSFHGLLARPTSFRLIEGLVPVLSTGSPSMMGDILFPSPAYLEDEFLYDEDHDLEWADKRNNVYWAGSSTGGYSSDSQWRHYQRQRFVSLAQNLAQQTYAYLQRRGDLIERVSSSFVNSRLYDVAFTRIFQCNTLQCRDQRSYFTVKYWADRNEVFRSRLAFDLDGNGISGRYYKILASKSTALKQTILREWHDDRLVPWVHYVPVSQGMEELPELISYLTSTMAGQRRAQTIADQGRQWHQKAFREVDLTVYTYRLMLELARLQDPKRQAG